LYFFSTTVSVDRSKANGSRKPLTEREGDIPWYVKGGERCTKLSVRMYINIYTDCIYIYIERELINDALEHTVPCGFRTGRWSQPTGQTYCGGGPHCPTLTHKSTLVTQFYTSVTNKSSR